MDAPANPLLDRPAADRFVVAGALVWAVVATAGITHHVPLGVIELLLLLGPLVVVPLGLTLPVVRPRPDHRLPGVMLAAAVALTAAYVTSGAVAVALTLPWLVVTAAIAVDVTRAWRNHVSRDWRPTPELVVRTVVLVGVAWLPLAALSITFDRAATSYAGLPPALIELAGVHLDFAGFGASIVAASVIATTAGTRTVRWAIVATAATVGGCLLVAIGHLTVRVFELAGASSMTVGVILLGVVSWRLAPARSWARVLLRISGLAVLGSMGFALAYSWSLTVGAEHLPYETIASVHGSLNAFGFVLCGLLGWRCTTSAVHERRSGVEIGGQGNQILHQFVQAVGRDQMSSASTSLRSRSS